MNFEEAIKAMKECKKVRRPCFDEGAFHYIAERDVWFGLEDGTRKIVAHISVEDVSATDWEIVKERTVSDKIRNPCSLGEPNNIKVEDVKEAIKRIREEKERKIKRQALGTSDSYIGGLNYMFSIIEEVFGDKLTKG